jgi:uncharacterized protein HemX
MSDEQKQRKRPSNNRIPDQNFNKGFSFGIGLAVAGGLVLIFVALVISFGVVMYKSAERARKEAEQLQFDNQIKVQKEAQERIDHERESEMKARHAEQEKEMLESKERIRINEAKSKQLYDEAQKILNKK